MLGGGERARFEMAENVTAEGFGEANQDVAVTDVGWCLPSRRAEGHGGGPVQDGTGPVEEFPG